MRKICSSKYLVSFLILIAFALSCRKVDNYPAPQLGVSGTITDEITGKAFLTEQPDGARVVFMDKGYPTPEPQRVWAMSDGTFQNNALFPGTYDVYIDEVAGVPSAIQTISVAKNEEVNFTIKPFLSIDTIEIKVEGKTITANYRVTKNVAEESVAERAIFLNKIPRVSQKDNVQSIKKVTNDAGEFRDKIVVQDSGTYYIRIAARTKNAFGRYNYSETIRIEVTGQGGVEGPDQGIEEGRMFESFEDESSLDSWETKYNFTTEFVEPGKVRITMGSIDGYGIFAKNNIAYNVSEFPIFAIKVFNAPPDDKWLIKLGDGSVDAVARGSLAKGTKDLPDGSKIYYWDFRDISPWTGEKTTNVQVAVEGSSQPLTFGWIRTFRDEQSVSDEDLFAEGRIFQLFEEESALDAWETKYNFTTEFLDPGKIRITMGTIDGYGIFARNNVEYNIDAFPIVAIKVFGAPPSDKWLIKFGDGTTDAVARGSLAKGTKDMPDGSTVYYWDFTEISAWNGDKTTNIQIAVEGSSQPLTFGWVKTFRNEASIK